MSDDTTDSPPTQVAAADTFVTSLYASFGPSENSADDGILTSSEPHERSSASNVTSLTPGGMHASDWPKNPLGSSLRNPGVTKESSSAAYLLTTTTTTANNIRASVFTADNTPTIGLTEADNAPMFAEISVQDLPMSVATDHLPVDVSTQELTTSAIRLTSSSTDNLLTPVSKAGDVLPSSDNALNSLFISIKSGTTDNLLTSLTTAAETNDGSTGAPMLSDDQLPTFDVLLTSSSAADNSLTPVSKADEFSSSSADDVLNSSYVSTERAVLDTTEDSILVRSSLGSKNRLLSATIEGLSSATSENLSSAKMGGLPSATSENLPSATSEYLPSATSEYLPSATSEYLPSATSEGLPFAKREVLPSATSESLPSAKGDGLPSATSENLPSSEPEVETLGGTTSGNLDLPSDYSTTSSDDGQSGTSATDAQSSGTTRIPRNHVTSSPTHVTGNGTAPTSYDRGFHFDEYNKNRVPNRNETQSPTTQSTESKALRISTNDLFSTSSLASGVPFVNNSTSSESNRVSSNLAQYSVLFGTLFAFALALVLINCVVIFLSAKRKDRRYRRRRPVVSRNISAISFRQISTQLDATVISVIIDEEEEDEEEEEEEDEWTDDNVDLLTHSPTEVIDPPLSPSLTAAERATPEDVPGLEPGALEEEAEEEIGARHSPGAGERQRRPTGESRRNGEAKGLRMKTGEASADDGCDVPGLGSGALEEIALSNVSTFTRTRNHL